MAGEARRRASNVASEAARSSSARALAAAAVLPAAAAAARRPIADAVAPGVGAGLAVYTVLEAVGRLRREVANGADGAVLAARLGPTLPALGTWAVEPDFVELVVAELRRGARVVVECGSGSSTTITAAWLSHAGGGSIISLDHDAAFAQETQAALDAAGLAERASVVVAPLVRQRFRGTTVPWYEREARERHLPEQFDLLVVDGPPSVVPWARWPALEVLHDRLRSGGVVLVDDGRTRQTRRSVQRWQREHRDYELYWHDTVKGTWRLVKLDGPRHEGAPERVLRSVLRTINPRPRGAGRWPVRR